MPEESTTPHLEQALRRSVEAFNRRDFDGGLATLQAGCGLGCVTGAGVFEGRDAVRGFIENWHAVYEDFEQVMENFRELGNGVTFGVFHQRARLPGSSRFVELRYGGFAISRERGRGNHRGDR